MAALWNRPDHYISVLWFLFSFFFPCLFSAIADWMPTILPHMMWPWCEFRIRIWNVLHAARWKYRMQKIAKKSPSRHHRTVCRAVSSQLRHVLTIRKKLVKEQYLLHMSSQYGKRWPTNGWEQFESSWHPANFNGFRILASLLHRRRSLEANQTLHDIWPSPGLVHYIYIFGGTCPLTEFWQVQNSLYVLLLYWQHYCMAHQKRASPKLCGVVQGMELRNFYRGRHLYSAGWPSRWASAHILVTYYVHFCRKT